MVAEVGVHDDDEVARDELQAVDVGGAEAQLAGASLEDDVGGVGLDELVGDVLGAVGRAVVDDDEFPIELAGDCQQPFGTRAERMQNQLDLLLCESAVQQPGHNGEVLALVVRRQDDRVLVIGALCRGHDVFVCWIVQGKKKNEDETR